MVHKPVMELISPETKRSFTSGSLNHFGHKKYSELNNGLMVNLIKKVFVNLKSEFTEDIPHDKCGFHTRTHHHPHLYSLQTIQPGQNSRFKNAPISD